MSIVLKSFLSFETAVFRFTLFDIPLIILGIGFGPIVAVIAGFVVDFVHMMFSPFAYSINLMTVSTIAWALIPALFFINKKFSFTKLVIVVLITSIVCFGLNTYQLYLWTGNGIYGALPARIISLVVKWPIQIALINIIYNRIVKRYI
jgi:ECF transporter S component (folate family)